MAKVSARQGPPSAAAGPRSPRQVYRDAVIELMHADPRTVCLDTDTGIFSGADFGTAADRYLDLGIAEQNVLGAAAGMAASGLRPFVHTMAAFAASRATEFIKIDVAHNALPVRIVATHAGLSGGLLGPTHHALEDLGVMRMLPHMTVLAPGDVTQLPSLMHQLTELPGPVYLRLDRTPAPGLETVLPDPQLGRIDVLGATGAPVLIIALGPHPLRAALAARDLLAAAGHAATVMHAHTLVPFDVAGFTAAAADTALIVSVEEHWITGGLGSQLAEVLAELPHRPSRLLRCGIPRTFVDTVGDHDHLLSEHGLTGPAIAARVTAALADTDCRQS